MSWLAGSWEGMSGGEGGDTVVDSYNISVNTNEIKVSIGQLDIVLGSSDVSVALDNSAMSVHINPLEVTVDE